MKLIKHPNMVQLHEVMASRTKIYMVLEFVDGGELFDKIVRLSKLSMAHCCYSFTLWALLLTCCGFSSQTLACI